MTTPFELKIEESDHTNLYEPADSMTESVQSEK